MNRKLIVAGNWKMNSTPDGTADFIKEFAPLISGTDAEVILCVPSICITTAVSLAKGTRILIGAQNLYYEDSGAYTGEISAPMIKSAGAGYVIIGHSERRLLFNEGPDIIRKKLQKAYEHRLVPILCCGESLEQRTMGVTAEWLRIQLKDAFFGMDKSDVERTIIAYEPIWAIGTGMTATAAQAQEACSGIRGLIAELFGSSTAQAVHVLYGGSVNEKNCKEIFSQPDIDGGLVGGASLKPSFAGIVNCMAG